MHNNRNKTYYHPIIKKDNNRHNTYIPIVNRYNRHKNRDRTYPPYY
jgi:hypothetical protein